MSSLRHSHRITSAKPVRLNVEQEQLYRQRTPRSRELLARTRALIPTGHGGGLVFQQPYPVLIERGEGPWIWDVDENRYLDSAPIGTAEIDGFLSALEESLSSRCKAQPE